MTALCPTLDGVLFTRCAVRMGLSLALSFAFATVFVYADAISPEHAEFFERHIRPVLVERCFECHSSKTTAPKGGLRLDTAETIRSGGDSGPAIVSGNADDSLLVQAIRYEGHEMPPDGKLPEDVIAHFEQWVALGAPDPRTETPNTPEHASPSTSNGDHWAFKPPQAVEPPQVRDASWPRSPVDKFILGRLEDEGLTPSPPAQPRTQLRRVAYALTGLPPSFAEMEAFAAAPTDEAYAAFVERLLASPQFGERWGRHWLDIARYADTKGYVFTQDRNLPAAPSYRDWVIAAFNSDLPYDRFVVAQLAADQMDDPSAKPAMGFLTLGRVFLGNTSDIIDDRIDVMTRGLLGLTVTCARCHDHKYDPIPTADYYSLYGVFASSKDSGDAAAPLMLVDAETPTEPVIFVRGNPSNHGPKVQRRFLSCLSNDEPQPFEHGSGRKELAEAIASPNNPLTARVWVNRVWGHLLGQALVTTPSDFGTRSDPPSHPELLDWLATQFVAEGWSTKQLIRQIVLSNAYRQSSEDRPECRERDPENLLVWRMNRQRLELEPLRDSLLLAAGRLDLALGGPSVHLTQAPFPTRRAVYGFIERQNLPGFFRTFDFAGPDTHAPQRPQTTVPQQALYLMNSPFVLQQAEHLVRRPEVASVASYEDRAQQIYEAALGRVPTAEELAVATEFLTTSESAAPESTNCWKYGWGTVDEHTGRVEFHELPHFAKKAWQGGTELPDPALGWVFLTANGGHTGDKAHMAIRRWTAPRAGIARIAGVLQHKPEKGDGVRARIVTAAGLAAEWTVYHGQLETGMTGIPVTQGDVIDLVVDCRENVDHDDFEWKTTITLQPTEGELQVFDSTAEFRGPAPLTPLERLAHVLLMSNEFAFVD
ncbi:MAG: PSD1 and planctomycete cytochrome C domain-containing protein [Pirellulales bacterium]